MWGGEGFVFLICLDHVPNVGCLHPQYHPAPSQFSIVWILWSILWFCSPHVFNVVGVCLIVGGRTRNITRHPHNVYVYGCVVNVVGWFSSGFSNCVEFWLIFGVAPTQFIDTLTCLNFVTPSQFYIVWIVWLIVSVGYSSHSLIVWVSG